MSFTLLQSGSQLQFLDSSGSLSTLTLPTGVTLRTDVPPRFAIYQDYVVMVNTPSRPLIIDVTGTVRPMVPKPPSVAPVLSAGSSGGLSGTYAKARVTFTQKDGDGFLISESDYSPASNSITLSSENLQATGVAVSTEDISSRRLYRPVTGGTVLFPWIDLDGNTITIVQDDLSDVGLSLLPAPILGNPPRLTLIKEWRDRLWGVGDVYLDDILYSEASVFYAWPSSNYITVPGAGRDQFGLRAFLPRREALGIGRRDIIWQLTGTTPDDWQVVKLSENTGIESQESVVVYRDIALWLWKDGVYQWDSEGLRNVSDPQVKAWFNKDSYFNRDLFSSAFAVFDPVRLKYRLFLAAAGSTTLNRWVEYDVSTRKWWGPHKTSGFVPTCAFTVIDDADKTFPAVGSASAYVWMEQQNPVDGTAPIEFIVDTKFYDGDMPDYEKLWGELSIIGKAQPRGQLQVIPKVGYLDATAKLPIPYNMTKGRQRLQRMGLGKLLQLRFQHNVVGEEVELYGFEVPHFVVGRR